MSNQTYSVEKENLIFKVIEELREKQRKYLEALEIFGRKRGIGFSEIWLVEDGVKKIAGERGDFTGHNLCNLSTGAILRALKQKYGNALTIEPLVITLIDKDVFPDLDSINVDRLYTVKHWILQISDGSRSFVIDATARQTDYSLIEGEIIIIPLEDIGKVYNTMLYSSENSTVLLNNIEEGFRVNAFPGVTIEDFEELSNVLY